MDITFLTLIARKVFTELETNYQQGKARPDEFSSGCMASFVRINNDWGLKLYPDKQWAETAMLRHLYLLDKDLAPNLMGVLYEMQLPGYHGERTMYGYLNGMCDEAYDSPTKEQDWPLMVQRYKDADCVGVLDDVSACGLNWGYRRTDRKAVVYDFLNWSGAPSWLGEDY